HLNAKNENEKSRRIVLEGRTGFARISGGVHREVLMSVSPDGQFALSGQPGSIFLTETATLESKRLNLPEGWLVGGAAFSPDSAHFVLGLVNPPRKLNSYVIADIHLQKTQPGPLETQFLRWLTHDTMLLKTRTGLSVYDIALGTNLPV